MRLLKIGIAAAALCAGGLAFAQTGPNPNLPGGGANVNVPPPGTVGGVTGTVQPSPLGQGNLPSTSTNNLGSSSGLGTSSSSSLQSPGANVPAAPLNSSSTTLNPPPSPTLTPPSSALNPPTGSLNPPPTTLNPPPNTLSAPLTQPNTLGVPNSNQPPTSAGTMGGLPTNR